MNKNQIYNIVFLLLAALLIYSFNGHASWLELCSGLAFFLFGMQCMTDGLQQLAGGKLERLLAKSTAKRWKGALFGVISTMLLQSTTIVSLLIIAFISSSLITLAGGFVIMLGAYLGSSSGVWLLALAGQSMSLAPFAYPLIVLGVLASFNGDKSKALGRVVLGIGFIFLAIMHMKTGFADFTTDFDFTKYQLSGFERLGILIAIGFFATTVLQSSHATIMLILTALDLKQITLDDGFILTVGAIWGSTVTTAVIGFIGGSRAGKRLALAHILFNFSTGFLALILLKPLSIVVLQIGSYFHLDELTELAVFHTIFNVVGISIFWQMQSRLICWLEKVVPDAVKTPLVLESTETVYESLEADILIEPKYLREQSLSSPAAAVGAVFKEVRHLGEVSAEVLCLSLNITLEDITTELFDQETFLDSHSHVETIDANILYQRYVKGLYGDILIYMSRIHFIDPKEVDYYQGYLLDCQMLALSMVDSIKSSRHLQKNFNRYLTVHDSIMRTFYQDLKLYLYTNIRQLHNINQTLEEDLTDPIKRAEHLMKIEEYVERSKQFERTFRREIFIASSKDEVNAFSTSSVMNDLSYCRKLIKSLYDIVIFTIESQSYPFANDDAQKHESEVEPISEVTIEQEKEPLQN